MNEMKRDMIRIQELVGSAFGQTGALVALSDGGHMNPKKLQKTLEQTMEHFESAALELRRLCEQYSPGVGGFAKKSFLPAMDVTGSVPARSLCFSLICPALSAWEIKRILPLH